jgi:hypothetical protein
MRNQSYDLHRKRKGIPPTTNIGRRIRKALELLSEERMTRLVSDQFRTGILGKDEERRGRIEFELHLFYFAHYLSPAFKAKTTERNTKTQYMLI